MNRRLFVAATLVFWLTTAGIWLASWLAPRPAPPAAPAEVVAPVEGPVTLAEVARHNRPGDCWMAIRGEVYALGEYLPDHPAEPGLLEPWCGREATEAYETKTRGRPHSRRADKLLALYRVGPLAGAPAPHQEGGKQP